jgi:phosphate transport system protein
MSKFCDEQERLKRRLLEMAALVEQMFDLSIRAVTDREASAAEKAFILEGQINLIEIEIDEGLINLLALHQPMASNLRFLVAGIKMNTNLERLGDLAVNIAQAAKTLLQYPPAAPIVDIPLMAGLVRSMLRKSFDAFALSDVELARGVLPCDDAVDRMRTSCYHQLRAAMEDAPEHLRQSLNLLMVTRTLERIADHATNVAEDVVFFVEGVEIRHGLGLQGQKQKVR